MKEHNHLKVKLLMSVYKIESKRYDTRMFQYCNECGMKMGESEIFNDLPAIPEVEGDMVRVICNVKSNGREYRWFGLEEDINFYIKHGDKWV